MAYHRGSILVAQRSYTYDTLGRPLTRSTARNGQTVNDSFVHNSRSELASAIVNGVSYGYDYDNIGNRRMAMEANDYTLYEANALNQYTSIQENEDTSFVPTFDADGNQTLVKTDTGIWSVVYNAENCPVCFTNADGSTVSTQPKSLLTPSSKRDISSRLSWVSTRILVECLLKYREIQK